VNDVGGACKADSARCPQGGIAPCADGRECTSIAAADPTCITPGQAGAACDPSETDLTRDGCADGFRCLSQEAVCGRACAAGGICPGTDECVDNVCFPQSPLGGPCPIEATTDTTAGDGDGCEAGLRCGFDANNNGPQCIQDECTTDADCPGGACNIPGCSQAERTCGTLVGEGGACFAGCLNAGCTNFTLSCAAGLECEHFLDACTGGDGSLGTCVVPGGQGAACQVTHDAAIDGCQAGLGCDQTTHTCL
jgi:hypothetical protein